MRGCFLVLIFALAVISSGCVSDDNAAKDAIGGTTPPDAPLRTRMSTTSSAPVTTSTATYPTTTKMPATTTTIGAAAIASTTGKPSPTTSSRPLTTDTAMERVEVIHFHGYTQCYSCKTIGEYSEETVNAYFSGELKSGKLVFAHVNWELPENKDLVTRYKVTGSSLHIGVYSKAGFSQEEDVSVWYKINDKEAFMTYLKGVIEKKLGR